jgi:hypothetical protein
LGLHEYGEAAEVSTAQGELDVAFVSVVNYPLVNAIEVMPDKP